MTSKIATLEVSWGPDYDYLYAFDTHYSIYTSSSYVPGTILVNKDNIDINAYLLEQCGFNITR